jgi:carbonic anhydrase
MVQDAWARGQPVMVHGWVYGLHNGLINDMSMSVANAEALNQAYDEAVVRLHERYDARARNPA